MKTDLLSTRLLVTIPALIFFACSTPKAVQVPVNDNPLLIEMVKDDQRRRAADSDDPLEPKDKIQRLKVMELLAAGLVKTHEDKMNAALILQHTGLTFCNDKLVSFNPENYFLAYTLSKSALDSGYQAAANFVATTYDRYLLYTEGYQKYGTQKVFDEKADEWIWAPIDPNTTDEERKKYKIKPLAELLKEARMRPLEKKGK